MYTEPYSDARRLAFVFPERGEPRYKVCPPDLCDLRWSVWDKTEKRTIARGASAVEAIDTAIHVTTPPPL
jgi:hypothetical protein